MFALNLPQYPIKVTKRDGRHFIFDDLRRKFVALTPEEWVRQHFVHYLTEQKGYPTGLIANEIQLNLNGTTKRCDTVVYDKQAHPRVIIEYKAPHIEITQKVFNQISRYNMVLHVDYLIVSNGLQHYCCRMNYKENTYEFLQDIPDYQQIPDVII
ncbi:MAG: type I restriction enzyme HsdR N-terminal domain-containing protein [Paraprevotella sp.]|nr:type I restriction enzyme HsdR N-terminal domain-containing protein [Paraprevotella sp.]